MEIILAGQKNWDEISEISSRSGYMNYINRLGPSYLDEGWVLLSYVEGRAAGFMKVEEMEDKSVWFSGVRVLPEFRRMHIGSSLTERACEFARENGFRSARLLIHEDNLSSIAMVKKIGFTMISEMAFLKGLLTDGMQEEKSLKVIPNLINLGWKFAVPSDSILEKATYFRSKGGAEVIRMGKTFQITRWAPDLEFIDDGISCIEIEEKLPANAQKYLLEDFDYGQIFEYKI